MRRRNARFLIVAAGLLAAGPASAALSPYYQSVAEIERILSDEQLGDALKQQAIVSIALTATDVYEVRTAQCTITVTVVDLPAPAGEPVMVGARQFDLQFGAATCKQE